ncbi:GDP-D-glucose phosphorylase 1 family protein [Thiohalomonas denitrificans]|uniref:ATP adenylyltransferase (5',5'''-P-1,P-4-tetraphosphate phosphorylase II) n=1 Tax=Thiohalomonas denitrificans TaxID=415747 RepID=A0A1G5PV03_9GAMM|nr:hypothetical protein [Thiohalomonas denitrificans]SCZ53247.1 ATP adenylyltransferase (5',5'''-P-1,P-4-tetraphosphate phosphorylase II) [Thiohalomonas denitrificans]
MSTADNIFASPDRLRHAFEKGLGRLLERDTLGPFILATANASFEPELWNSLRPALEERFEELSTDYRARLLGNGTIPDGDEDLTVFLKLAFLGFNTLEPTRFRQAGPWEVQFNPLRAFRPQRMSTQSVDGIRKPFNPDGFHFNKPFMEKEILWEGDLGGSEAALYYNKYPFVDRHGLLVPERHQQHPQFLTPALHDFAWKQTARLGETLPGVGLGYNAYGAGASVNHLHLQLFVRDTPLPIADPHFSHNGGSEPYPAHCMALDDAEETWQQVEALHRAGIAYNLLYLPGRAYLLPRRTQGSFAMPDWCGTCAWYEMAGGMVTSNRELFSALTSSDIAGLLREATI